MSCLTRPAACALLAASVVMFAMPAQAAGAGAPRSAAAASRPALDGAAPVYQTRIPPSARLSFRLSRSGIVGSGLLDWRVENGGYVLRLEGSVPLFGTLIVQTSRGGFDAAGLAPLRYTDKRLSRSERVARFDRAAGTIGFSNGKAVELPRRPGVQDRLSVMLQLAAIAHGWEQAPRAGAVFTIPVVGARGDLKLWALRYEGADTVHTPAGSVRALRFLRQSDEPDDTRAEFWLDPALSYLPVRARLTDGDGDALELLRSPEGP